MNQKILCTKAFDPSWIADSVVQLFMIASVEGTERAGKGSAETIGFDFQKAQWEKSSGSLKYSGNGYSQLWASDRFKRSHARRGIYEIFQKKTFRQTLSWFPGYGRGIWRAVATIRHKKFDRAHAYLSRNKFAHWKHNVDDISPNILSKWTAKLVVRPTTNRRSHHETKLIRGTTMTFDVKEESKLPALKWLAKRFQSACRRQAFMQIDFLCVAWQVMRQLAFQALQCLSNTSDAFRQFRRLFRNTLVSWLTALVSPH